jgi:transglutaminase-like putative cysteine protease
MIYNIIHRTTFEYTASVTTSHHVARLEPRNTTLQVRDKFSLKFSPDPTLRKTRNDYFGNQLCFFSIQEVHHHLEVTATSRVTVNPVVHQDFDSSAPWEDVAQLFRDPVAPDIIEPYQFVFDSPQIRASMDLSDYARQSFKKSTTLLRGTADLMKRIQADFKYDPKATTVATPLEEVLEKRHGVCQDFAHLGIACLRSIGLAARYVSGYLRTRPPEGKERLVGADASHAWFALYCPRNGWVEFDPTNNIQPSQEHITLAYGRDFGDVSPVAGILTGGGAHEVKVSVDVAELDA